MPRAKKDFIRLAEERGGSELPPSVNGQRILKRLEDGTLRSYQDKVDEWERFVESERIKHPDQPPPTVSDLKALKKFVRMMALAIDGTKGLNACVETVRNYCNRFTAGWKRIHEAIRQDLAESVTNYIYGELMEELRLLREKKPRRYANSSHITSFGKRYWGGDWKEYDSPATRLNDWDLFLVDVFSSARILDYIESTCRRGTNRGLKFKDVMFICFWNKYGKPEFAVQRTKDAKNFSRVAQSKKPKNSIAEGCEEAPLLTNSLLFTLARLLSKGAFRDYSTIEDLLHIVPPTGTKSFHIAWREDVLEHAFYPNASQNGSIETASAFHKRLMEAGIRADKHYSESDRMRAGAHENPNTYGQSYQSSESRVDGQNTFLGNERRENVSDAFLELSVHYTPNLAQRLPAEERYNLQRRQDYLELEDEIEALRDDKNAEAKDRFKELQRMKSRLMDEAFQECAKLRDPLGLSVLRDLIALLEKNAEVEFRPGLEEDKCVCPKVKKEPQDEANVTPSKYDWRHIYNCYKKDRCKQGWRGHCLGHLKDLSSFPTHFDPLTTRSGVLATPGHCPYCLRDERLPPEKRMYQYLNRAMWLSYIQKHIEGLERCEREGKNTVRCPHPHPRCPESFDTILHLRFHLEDVHGIPMAKESKVKKRSRRGGEQARQPPKKQLKNECGSFINVTAATMKARLRKASKAPSGCSTNYQHSADSVWGEDWYSGSDPPPSSTSSDAQLDPVPDIDFVLIDEVEISTQPPLTDGPIPFLDLTSANYGFQEGLLEANVMPEHESVSSGSSSGLSTPFCSSNSSPLSSVSNGDLIDSLNDIELGAVDVMNLAASGEIPQSTICKTTKKKNDSCAEAAATAIEVNTRQVEELAPLTSAIAQPPAVDPGDNQWEVEELQGRRKVGRGFMYLVKWLGYPETESTWEKRKDISAELVMAYDAMHPLD
ncbi:hypothetical protein CC80DRAFT_551828 [Byssothecium circinans]|uniref:Chromo domain-containing protein n=1 Tax=Byssothecium circinans TaxID=147558 RepID=A0A6A5TK93_9PLEO|nr:hypothetical protein CC80DRAFT_551828 [Byssothecium circinans]